MLRPSKRSSSDDWGGFCIKSIFFIVEFYKYKKPLKNGKISKKSYKYNSPWPLRVKIRDKFIKWIIIEFHQFHVSFLVEDELLVCECRNICLSAVSCDERLWLVQNINIPPCPVWRDGSCQSKGDLSTFLMLHHLQEPATLIILRGLLITCLMRFINDSGDKSTKNHSHLIREYCKSSN